MKFSAPRSSRPLKQRMGHKAKEWWRLAVRVQDTPHRVAFGFALGMVLAWLPIVGVQMLVGAIICFIFRANILASIPPIWISNPLTMVPMYWLENQLGAMFAGEAISLESMGQIWTEVGTISGNDGIWAATKYLVSDGVYPAFEAMMVGGAIIGVICAIPSYYMIRKAVVTYQSKRDQKRQNWRDSMRLQAQQSDGQNGKDVNPTP